MLFIHGWDSEHGAQPSACALLQELKELARNISDDIDLQPNDRDILAWKAVIKVCRSTVTCAHSTHEHHTSCSFELHLLPTVFPKPHRVPWTARIKGASFSWQSEYLSSTHWCHPTYGTAPGFSTQTYTSRWEKSLR